MARRSTGRSRSSRSTRSPRSSSAGGRSSRGSARARGDGRVDAPCPQCGTVYRVSEDALDEKLECQECYRTFFPKTTAGKRGQTQDNSKVYLGFGGLAVFIVITFWIISSGSGTPPEQPKQPKPSGSQYSLAMHPRVTQAMKWAQAIQTGNRLVFEMHSDLPAIAAQVGAKGSTLDDVLAAVKEHKSARYLRDLNCESAELTSKASMTEPDGQVILRLMPDLDSKDYNYDRAEILATFHMDGTSIRVETWKEIRVIIRKTRDPNAPKRFTPNKDIERAKYVEISDTGGTRRVMESPPGPVPHWEDADAVQRQKVDQAIADIIRSADPETPGGMFTRAVLSFQNTLEDRKSAVPRALNAMYELYEDPLANNMKLSQLNQALVSWTGMAVNYQVKSSGNPELDKTRRQSCIRQWFAVWWRYSSGDGTEFFDTRENLDDPLPGEPGYVEEKKK